MSDVMDRLSNRWVWGLVIGTTLLGLVLRLVQYDYPLFGDELSTLWIVRNYGFFDTIHTVSTDAEITPPLYFMLAWLTTHIGDAPELVRLPAMFAGVACIPLTFMLGLRTVGRPAGLIGAFIVAISPFMTYFSADGRAYSLMLALLIGSTLAMLAAVRTGRLRWWVVYGVCICLSMYSHYTGMFVLAAQLAWVLWFHPPVRVRALVSTGVAGLLFLPWLPSLRADNDSPTKAVMEFLQGDGFHIKRLAVEQWLAGEPLVDLSQVPGRLGLALLASGLVVAAVAFVWRLVRRGWPEGPGANEEEPAAVDADLAGSGVVDYRSGFILILAITLVTPVAELIALAAGTDLFGARNLAPAWAGTGVLIGAMIAGSFTTAGMVAGLLVLAGFGIGAVKMTNVEVAGSGYKEAANFIEDNAAPGDVVVDASHYTPVPLTELDAHLPQDHSEYRVNLPVGDPPFVPVTSVTLPVQQVLNRAFDEAKAGDNRVFAVTPRPPVSDNAADQVFIPEDGTVPRGWKIDESKSWPGIRHVSVTVLSRK